MGLNAVNTIQSEMRDLTDLAERIGKAQGMQDWQVDPSVFKHVRAARHITPTRGIDQQVLLWSVPRGMDFVMTYSGLKVLDFTKFTSSDDLCLDALTAAYLKRNGKPIGVDTTTSGTSGVGISYLQVANAPVLLLFQENDVIGLIVN